MSEDIRNLSLLSLMIMHEEMNLLVKTSDQQIQFLDLTSKLLKIVQRNAPDGEEEFYSNNEYENIQKIVEELGDFRSRVLSLQNQIYVLIEEIKSIIAQS